MICSLVLSKSLPRATHSLNRFELDCAERFPCRRVMLVSSSLKSPSSDTGRQEAHQPASLASRLRGRLPSDHCRTTHSPLARALLPGGAWPQDRQRAAAWSFPYSAFVLCCGSPVGQARFDDHRILPPHPSQASSSSILGGPSCVIPPVCLFFYLMRAMTAIAASWPRSVVPQE
jgi:hypothetical protein